MANFIQNLNTNMAEIVAEVRRSLVHINNGRMGTGAGTIWHPDGLIITNAHVISRGTPTVTLPDGQSFKAQVLAHDPERDLAALAIDARGLPTITPGDSRRLRPGDWVLALGHPYGVAGAVTAGMVIGSGAEWPELPTVGREWVIVGLHMRPGHSGGPMVDGQGRLVGVNTMINGPDVGCAVPVHIVKRFLRQSIKALPEKNPDIMSTP